MTSAEADALRRAEMDMATVRRQQAMKQIMGGLDRMRTALAASGFVVHRIFEQRDPASGILVSTAYAGDEFYVTIVHANATYQMRIHQAMIERDPACVDNLTRVILRMKAGSPVTVWRDAGGAMMGLEADGVLVGDRPQAPSTLVDDDPSEEQIAAEIAAHETRRPLDEPPF